MPDLLLSDIFVRTDENERSVGYEGNIIDITMGPGPAGAQSARNSEL